METLDILESEYEFPSVVVEIFNRVKLQKQELLFTYINMMSFLYVFLLFVSVF